MHIPLLWGLICLYCSNAPRTCRSIGATHYCFVGKPPRERARRLAACAFRQPPQPRPCASPQLPPRCHRARTPQAPATYFPKMIACRSRGTGLSNDARCTNSQTASATATMATVIVSKKRNWMPASSTSVVTASAMAVR